MPILYIMPSTLDPQDLTPSIEGNNLEDPDTPPPERNPSPALAAFFDAVRANIATNQAIITELYNAVTQIPHEERQGKAYIDELWSKYDTLQSPDHITPFERRHLDEGTKLKIRNVEHKIKLLTGVIEREERLRACGYYDDEAIRKRVNESEKANASESSSQQT
ncbi:hypothetical protein DID88_000333 [Monilinia fructigena]|uniref:Uncharacterized protein n=1 Tax=Monilinia fructigena TaxID=38457 RepID=A0A395IHP4_9HELO|nr:hypothetical protein DID88_000333 [Monilinia fructigena]